MGCVDGKSTATVADALSNQVVTQLRTRYLEFVNREADYSRKYGANHLAVVNLRDRVRELRGSILDELKRLREGYLSNYEIAKQREQDLEKSLAAAVVQSQETNQAQVALRELESTAQTYRTMHDNFLQRYTELLQQESFPISDARIVTPASPPDGKSGPKRLLILAMAMAGGLALGVGAGVLRDLMNGSVCTAVQAETALQAPCIAIVPSLNGQKSENKSIVKGARLAGLPSRQGLSEGAQQKNHCSGLGRNVGDTRFSLFSLRRGNTRHQAGSRSQWRCWECE